MQNYKKSNDLTSVFTSFLILIFSFLISTDIAAVSGFLRVVDIILFFILTILGTWRGIKILRDSFYVHNWKNFTIAIFILSLYLCLLVKVFATIGG